MSVTGRIILTAAEMRAAEAATIAAGTSVHVLMERAGTAAAEATAIHAGPRPALVLCGPGNNGGDGYVIARMLRARGIDVRVAALAEPTSEAAREARRRWDGEVVPLDRATPAPVLIDALFGTGLARPLDPAVADRLSRLAGAAAVRVAIDLPSGAATDDGRLLSPVPDYDLTVTFASLKPSHLLQPAARHMGRVVVADIGILPEGQLREIGRPHLPAPGPDDHKYSRGYVAVVEGDMPGAAALSASAALHSGAGYVRLFGPAPIANVPNAVVQGGKDAPEDPRIDTLVVGPGLGRSAEALARLERLIAGPHPLVLDADALHLLAGHRELLRRRASLPILTPHAGEFARLFGTADDSKVEQARRAAAAAGAVVTFKGPDTVVAAPDGRAAISPPAPAWLASAGTGDVLTGAVAAMRARGLEPFEAACAGVWLHRRAAQHAGPALTADRLALSLGAALAECQ